MKNRAIAPLILAAVWAFDAAAPSTEAWASRGYAARPCGFDLNRNGVIGEAADCRVCDGTTADPDADGVAEDLIYIDCQAGTDNAGCGSPSNPCRTIAHAWGNRADGPGDGAEDILCFRGTCREESIPTGVDGVSGTYTVPRTGSQARSWQFPRNPTMLVGWDSDGDHAYPPFDTDDVAVLDGAGAGFDYAVSVASSRVEIAHFTARHYGRDGTGHDSGFSTWGAFSPLSHIYFHDLSLIDVNRNRGSSSGRVTLSMWAPKISHLAYVNLQILNTAGYISRGTGPADGVNSSGPIRYERLSVTADPCDDGVCPFIDASLIGFKLWDWVEGVEVIDSVFDSQLGLPNPPWVPGHTIGVLPAQCSRDWVVRNNEFVDFRIGLSVQGYAGGGAACDSGPAARTVTGVVFDRNLMRGSYDWDVFSSDSAVRITDVGPNATNTAEDVKITNNIFHFTGGSQGLLLYQGGRNGAPLTAPITIVGNTFSGDIDRPGFAGILLTADAGAANYHRNWDVRNNIFVGLGSSDLAVSTQFAPLGWSSNYNVYDADADYSWNGGNQSTLAAWRASSGGDANSRECAPSFVGAADLHLSASDTCAAGAGGNVGPVTAVDYDGDPRPMGTGWEIGADEIGPGGGNVPPTVTILAPPHGSTYPAGTLIGFSGTASDPENGDLTSSLVWTSSLDGTIGTGGSFSVALSAGSHQVTASVVDGGGLSGSDSITVTVQGGPPPPCGDGTCNGAETCFSCPTDCGPCTDCGMAVGASVSSSGTPYPNADSSKLVDGVYDEAGGFWAAQGSPNWAETDLGTPMTVARIKIDPYGGSPGNPYYYDEAWNVQYRDAGGVLRDFQNVVKVRGAGALAGPGIHVTGGQPGTPAPNPDYMSYEFSFTPVVARSFRYTVTVGDQDGDANGTELDLCGESSLLFADGFESGDVGVWSAAAP